MWGYELYEKTDRIPGDFGVTFGFSMILKSNPKETPVTVAVKRVHPKMQAPSSRPFEDVRELTKALYPGKPVPVLFTFGDPWELAPGDWTFQVPYREITLREAKFTVSEVANT